MNARALADIEAELVDVTDQIAFWDDYSALNRQIDGLRAVARKLAVEVELQRLREREASYAG